MKKHLISALVSAMVISSPVIAAEKFTGKLETCMKAALAKHAGEIISLEAELDKGKAIYEFDIKGKDGKEWEVECAAASGKVIEENLEVTDATDPAFKVKAKITQDEAKKVALAKYAGEVVETEFKIEVNGNPSYEFDIKTPDGKEYEIEIDAVTGKVVGDQIEIYQIGLDQAADQQHGS